jgi:hypothetical protein
VIAPNVSTLSTKPEFIAAVAAALRGRTGFAAGKLGPSELFCLSQPLVRSTVKEPHRLRAYEVALGRQGETQTGTFPRDPGFYLRYFDAFAGHMRSLDFLGLFGFPKEQAVLRHYRIANRVMDFRDQEPDRSVPDDPRACYLPHFAGKRLLLVSPFALLLKSRANRETFEAVWAKTGKRWFHPRAVEALVVPYGWSKPVQAQHGDSFRLLEHLYRQMERSEFDVALIGAGAMGIPLASYAKSLGRAAIVLGGHLQVLFGVLGKRWRESEEWQRNYINSAWIDPPPEYVPTEEVLVDDGAYW